MTITERRNQSLQRWFELSMDRYGLSDWEKVAVRELRFGLSITAIAHEVGITYDSAYGFVHNAIKKAHVETDTELILKLYGLPHGRAGEAE